MNFISYIYALHILVLEINLMIIDLYVQFLKPTAILDLL